jgi:hypothetical protein
MGNNCLSRSLCTSTVSTSSIPEFPKKGSNPGGCQAFSGLFFVLSAIGKVGKDSRDLIRPILLERVGQQHKREHPFVWGRNRAKDQAVLARYRPLHKGMQFLIVIPNDCKLSQAQKGDGLQLPADVQAIGKAKEDHESLLTRLDLKPYAFPAVSR